VFDVGLLKGVNVVLLRSVTVKLAEIRRVSMWEGVKVRFRSKEAIPGREPDRENT
jgi:hypothetical protein